MGKIVDKPEGESETLLTGGAETRETPEPAPQREDGAEGPPPPGPRPVRRPRPPLRAWVRRVGRFPMLILLAYYAVLIAVDAALITYVPLVREAFVEPAALGTFSDAVSVLEGGRATGVAAPAEPVSLETTFARALRTLLVVLGALSLVFPVAWVYMRTKRFRYDPALVRSVVILPIVVAGIALVVKDSVALAFALAGIVAAVRFRNTLKDPRDAVYIFLVIGIGLAAGVQVLDVALVMSLVFNVVVLFLWRYNVGSVYSGRYARTGMLTLGDPSLLVARSPQERREIRSRLLEEAEGVKADGILLVHTSEPEVTRYMVQEALGDTAKDWKLAGVERADGGLAILEYAVKLRKKRSPHDLVGALDERWSDQVEAVEFFPFRKRKRKRKKSESANILTEGDGRDPA